MILVTVISVSYTHLILSAEKHPKADKLLVFQVKMGTEKRQIISGVAEDFTPEEMVGKKVIVVANLKPRKMCIRDRSYLGKIALAEVLFPPPFPL